MVLSVVLPWILIALVLIVAPVALRLYAEDNRPRSDDPPDTGEDNRDPGPVALPIAA